MILDSKDQLDQEVLTVHQEQREILVRVETRVRQERLVVLAALDSLDQKDRVDQQDLQDKLDLQEQLDLQAQLVSTNICKRNSCILFFRLLVNKYRH